MRHNKLGRLNGVTPPSCFVRAERGRSRREAVRELRWVEQGEAPIQIAATAGRGTPWPGRTRPLCAYPAVARYKGSGDVNDAASFVCRP